MTEITVEVKAPGYYNVIEYQTAPDTVRYAVEANCPCGCGHGIWLPITGPGVPKTEHNWTWDGNKAQPTLGPSIRRIGGCAFHGYLQAGVWSSAGDGAPLSPAVYRGGPDHPIEPRRVLMTETTATAAPPADETNQAPDATKTPEAATEGAQGETAQAKPETVVELDEPPKQDLAGFSRTMELKIAGGKLLQKWTSAHDGAMSVWVAVDGQ